MDWFLYLFSQNNKITAWGLIFCRGKNHRIGFNMAEDFHMEGLHMDGVGVFGLASHPCTLALIIMAPRSANYDYYGAS